MAVSRSAVYGCLGVLALGVFWWSNQDDTPPAPLAPTKVGVGKGANQVLDLTPDDFQARFDKPKSKTRNLFVPLITVSNQIVAPDSTPLKNIIRIPAKLAGGDANWIFTGFAIEDGSREALFENTGTHLGTYVKQGTLWKSARLLNVSSDSVTLSDEHGLAQVVLRYNPQLEANAKAKDSGASQAPNQNPGNRPDAGTQPMQIPPGFRGRIGGSMGPNITFSPLPPAMAGG